MVMENCPPFRGILCFRKREVERRALIQRSFTPHPPAMAVDDALNGGQSYSGAFKLFG
jgi:hypothetical protein